MVEQPRRRARGLGWSPCRPAPIGRVDNTQTSGELDTQPEDENTDPPSSLSTRLTKEMWLQDFVGKNGQGTGAVAHTCDPPL